MTAQAKQIAKGLWAANQELAEEIAHEIYELRDEAPLPQLEVDTKVLVWDERYDEKRKMYFSHFDKEGDMHCFLSGLTSWNSKGTLAWRNWELADETKI